MQYWYALNAKPHKERQVETILTGRGIEVYFPAVPASHRRGRSAERAFFPGYLFAHVELDVVGLWSLHYTPGMRGVVMFGGIPARIDDRVIDGIRERLANANVVDEQGEILERGDRVVITSGPFAELEAVFDQRLSPQGRVRVLIELIQRWNRSERWIKVDLDADRVKKISIATRR